MTKKRNKENQRSIIQKDGRIHLQSLGKSTKADRAISKKLRQSELEPNEPILDRLDEIIGILGRR